MGTWSFVMHTMIFATNPFFEAFATSDAFGKLIFLSLLALSVLSGIVLTNKIRLLKETREQSKLFALRFGAQRAQPLSVSLPEGGASDPFDAIYRVVRGYSSELLRKNSAGDDSGYLSTADISLVASQVDSAIGQQVEELEGYLFILPTTVTLAPFLGLLGTVWGCLVTFSQLQHQAFSQSNQVVMGGLSTALATTVLGLLVAIPALIGYNYLRTSLRSFERELEDFSSLVLVSVEMQYRKVEV